MTIVENKLYRTSRDEMREKDEEKMNQSEIIIKFCETNQLYRSIVDREDFKNGSEKLGTDILTVILCGEKFRRLVKECLNYKEEGLSEE